MEHKQKIGLGMLKANTIILNIVIVMVVVRFAIMFVGNILLSPESTITSGDGMSLMELTAAFGRMLETAGAIFRIALLGTAFLLIAPLIAIHDLLYFFISKYVKNSMIKKYKYMILAESIYDIIVSAAAFIFLVMILSESYAIISPGIIVELIILINSIGCLIITTSIRTDHIDSCVL